MTKAEQAEERRRRKADLKAYEQMCARQARELRTKEMQEVTELWRHTEWCEESIERLLLPGDFWDAKKLEVRSPTTAAEELESALMWATALGIKEPVVWGSTTLLDLARRIYWEWRRVKRPRLNPYSKAFSNAWELKPAAEAKLQNETLEDFWEFIPDVDYNAAIPAPAASTAVPDPEPSQTAAEQFDAWQESLRQPLPTLQYRGILLKHSDEE